MRIAVLSDIHGNLHALDAVLSDVEREDVHEIWCLGDIVGYGADPHDCCARARARARAAARRRAGGGRGARRGRATPPPATPPGPPPRLCLWGGGFLARRR